MSVNQNELRTSYNLPRYLPHSKTGMSIHIKSALMAITALLFKCAPKLLAKGIR